MSVDDLLRIFRDKQARDSAPYWGCITEPACEEIRQAICLGNLVAWAKDGDKSEHQGNHSWHIGRIAWLAVNWKSDYPIRVNKAGTDVDGGHRLYAAHYRGIKELDTTDL